MGGIPEHPLAERERLGSLDDDAVLLVQPRDRGLAIGGPRVGAPVAVPHDRVPAERLRAAVHRRPRSADADDGAHDPERQVILRGRARLDLHQVVEHIGSRPNLGNARNPRSRSPGGRASGGRLLDRDSAAAKPLGQRDEQLSLLLPAGVEGRSRRAAPNATVGGDALQLESRQVVDELAEPGQLVELVGASAAASEPCVDVELHPEPGAGALRRHAQPSRRQLAVEVDRRCRARCRERSEALARVLLEHRKRDDDVVDPSPGKCLRLGDLRADDSGSPESLLAQRELDGLVRLDVRAEEDAAGVERALPGREIALETIEVDEQRGRRHPLDRCSRPNRLRRASRRAPCRLRRCIHRTRVTGERRPGSCRD